MIGYTLIWGRLLLKADALCTLHFAQWFLTRTLLISLCHQHPVISCSILSMRHCIRLFPKYLECFRTALSTELRGNWYVCAAVALVGVISGYKISAVFLLLAGSCLYFSRVITDKRLLHINLYREIETWPQPCKFPNKPWSNSCSFFCQSNR